MKKTLLIIALGFTFLTASAQVLYSTGFTEYNQGSLTTNITGTGSFQQGWLSWATPNSGSSIADFNIYSNGNPGNSIYMVGFDHYDQQADKYLWKDGFPQLWNTRTSGNNTLEVQIDFKTSPFVVSSDRQEILILDESLSKVLAGYAFSDGGAIQAFMYNYDTTSNTFGNFFYNLEDNVGVNLPSLIWMKLILRFNSDTGEATYIIKYPNGSIFRQKSITGSGAGLNPAEVDFAIHCNGFLTESAKPTYDNYKVTALSSALAVDEVADDSGFSIYPNPASDEINVSNTRNEGISTITITDMNGRIVKQNTFENIPNVQMNVSDLSKGIYILKVKTQAGYATQRLIVD